MDKVTGYISIHSTTKNKLGQLKPDPFSEKFNKFIEITIERVKSYVTEFHKNRTAMVRISGTANTYILISHYEQE